MRVDLFDFELPKELIAERPVHPKDESKLLDLSSGSIQDKIFKELPAILNENDLLVFNNTKVIPARLFAYKGEAKIEVTLYRPVDGINWWALIKNSKRLKEGSIIQFYNDFIPIEESCFSAEVIEKKDGDGVLIRFNVEPQELNEFLEKYGHMPLPPYIKRDHGADEQDKADYQTIYAKHEGAVAAPTAGLHFTDNVMKELIAKGVKTTELTLHVGAGTFLPVKSEDTDDHKMHAEYGIINQESADIINQTKKNGGRVIAVGTTSLRLLESATDDNGIIKPFADDTAIFITPGYKFKMVDMLITNFHLPKSTLFMLVCALAGTEAMKEAYEYAMAHKYRFYSYGDSSILPCVNKRF